MNANRQSTPAHGPGLIELERENHAEARHMERQARAELFASRRRGEGRRKEQARRLRWLTEGRAA